jgi:DNA-directed RNA polymerase subunit RPC12/RpoP
MSRSKKQVEQKEDLLHQIKELNKEIKLLKRTIANNVKVKPSPLKSGNIVKEKIEVLSDIYKCQHCHSKLERTVVGNRTIIKCTGCDFRTTMKPGITNG